MRKRLISILLVFSAVFMLLPINLMAESYPAEFYPDTSSYGYVSNENIHTRFGYGGQCTAFVWGRVYEKLGISLWGYGDAKNWYTDDYPKGSEPAKNSIAVWTSSTTGHVAFVEDVVGDKVIINEANFDAYANTKFGGGYDGAPKTLTKEQMKYRSGNTLLGYVYLDGQKSSPTNSNSSKNNLKIYVNNNLVEGDVAPFIDSAGRTMVPLRFVSEAFGGEVIWLPEYRSVAIYTINDYYVFFQVGSNEYYVDEEPYFMDTKAVIVSERAFVPLRFLAEAMQMTVNWNEATRTISIY